MKVLVQAFSIVAALAAPALAFAQSSSSITHAQVRNELVQLEKAGYRLGDGDQTNYPEQIQRAEARVSQADTASNDYGGATNGSSASGSSKDAAPQAEIPGLKPIYFGQ
ncbi:DUF4148 domain-containing protein [Paraburkholderia sp. BL10I2N1]|uniref:DUF4148 domain-containing protein n=1 Tax=Paraburkholderia sp. BL10I2N1 TaxID=1938796 RepID=UPI00105E21BB|nr:DUF4148 domain-containing protein [Paraburkholderia sp. BL10I2N1]